MLVKRGRDTLIELTQDGLAILQFGGGCNGCAMVDVTLKEGIEKELLEKFPGELTGVRDVTEHRRGDHRTTGSDEFARTTASPVSVPAGGPAHNAAQAGWSRSAALPPTEPRLWP